MALQVEDLDDQTKYRQILKISYDDLIPFILDYMKRISAVTIFFWSACLFFLGTAVRIRIEIQGYFPLREIMVHSALGAVLFPLLSIPLHEFLHIIPYYFSGARKIRVGMDLKQYLFYVTAHRYVATSTAIQDSGNCSVSPDKHCHHCSYSDDTRFVEMEPVSFSFCSCYNVCR